MDPVRSRSRSIRSLKLFYGNNSTLIGNTTLFGKAIAASNGMNDKKFYITTSIAYTNAAPHIGYALEEVQADVLARFYRSKEPIFFLTGTDEHGATNVRAADKAGVSVAEFTEAIAGKFKALKESLNLSWDDFIRTTDRVRHWPGAELMWQKLVLAHDIYKKNYNGLYCIGHEAFITRKDLVGGKCRDHLTEPEVIEEENYFFRLSKYAGEIETSIKSDKLRIVPETRKNEILSLIKNEGLEDVSFSRPRKDLSWGIPVPGDDSETMYVWCDALTNYLSAVGYGRNKDYKKFWPADIQVIGKDILRFHAAIWPGMLLSAGLPLPRTIFVHGFVTVDGQKMSKTIGNIVDPFVLVKKYGIDAVRYYLLREIPSGEDGDYSEAKFKERYNGDLANGLGNFAARVLTLGVSSGKFFEKLEIEEKIEKKVSETREKVYGATENFKLHEALAALWGLISFGDAYVNEKKPWAIEDAKAKEAAIFNLVVILDNVAALLQPFLPETSEKITQCIKWDGNTLKIEKAEKLFPRLL